MQIGFQLNTQFNSWELGIGIISSAGRYGGTYAHKDIAFEFATWLSPEFKLYLIKEFQRLKDEEKARLETDWDVKRQPTKINYRIHTDAIQENLIPRFVTKNQANIIYASEAELFFRLVQLSFLTLA